HAPHGSTTWNDHVLAGFFDRCLWCDCSGVDACLDAASVEAGQLVEGRSLFLFARYLARVGERRGILQRLQASATGSVAVNARRSPATTETQHATVVTQKIFTQETTRTGCPGP